MSWLRRQTHQANKPTGSASDEPDLDAAARARAQRAERVAIARAEAFAGVPTAEMTPVRDVDGSGRLVHVGVSFSNELIVATSVAERSGSFASSDGSPGFATFPRGTAENAYPLRVATYTSSGHAQTIEVDGVPVAFPHIQVLPDEGLLIVGARSHLRDGVGERNAFLVDRDGKLGESFCIGDGVSSIQVTPSGRVWAGYFDEGVFGNFGWGLVVGQPPLGQAGLVCWSLSGEQLFRFEPPPGLGPIDDCYAMCANGETAWACYYSDFYICRTDGNWSTTGWLNGTAGAHQIAAHHDRVGLIGGYNGLFDRLVVGRLGESTLEEPSTWRLALPGGEALPPDAAVVARGRFIHALTNGSWFTLDITAMGD